MPQSRTGVALVVLLALVCAACSDEPSRGSEGGSCVFVETDRDGWFGKEVDTKCNPGLVCEHNGYTCVRPPPPAAAGSPCGGLQRCAAGLLCMISSGVCEVPRNQGERCASDEDCASGLDCLYRPTGAICEVFVDVKRPVITDAGVMPRSM